MSTPVHIESREVDCVFGEGLDFGRGPIIEDDRQRGSLLIAQEPTLDRGCELHCRYLWDNANREALATTQRESAGEVCDLAVGEDFQIVHFT